MSNKGKELFATNSITITYINGVVIPDPNKPTHVPNNGNFEVRGTVNQARLDDAPPPPPPPDVYLYIINSSGNLYKVGQATPDPTTETYTIPDANINAQVPTDCIVVLLALWGDLGSTLAQTGAEIQADL